MKGIKIVFTGIWILCVTACTTDKAYQQVRDILKEEVLLQAGQNMNELPATITCFIPERSVGTIHDFFSEGDYWWPDTLNPDGPYIRRAGQINPDNFIAHRQALIRFSSIVGNLTSAYLLTDNKEYVDQTLNHIRAWFVDEETKMNPRLTYAQAIRGVTTGRGVGIMETIHLIEVARSLQILEKKNALPSTDKEATKRWFAEYLQWITTHPYGMDSMNAPDIHAACWVMQAAIFASYIGDKETLELCTRRYKEVLLPYQMNTGAGFPWVNDPVRPYTYSLFTLDVLATICRILSDKENDLWNYTSYNGRNIYTGVDALYPYLKNQESWPLLSDSIAAEEQPVAQPFLLFSALQSKKEEYMDTWLSLNHFPAAEVILRNFPVRNPLVWIYKHY